MKPRRPNLRRLSIVTFILLTATVRCSVPVVPTLLPSSVTLAPVTPTPSPSPTSPTCTPTPSPVSPTRTPSPTQTPQLPTPTAGPTLTTDEERVLDLLQNNAGCRLPCWWGFTPGETTWQTAQAFFASLGKTPAEWIPTKYPSPHGTTIYSVNFNLPDYDIQMAQTYVNNGSVIERIWVSSGTVRNHEPVYGDPQFLQIWRPYTLPEMLTTYGLPGEIMLALYQSTPMGWLPFQILLFYPDQGILVRYYGPAELQGDQLRACPHRSDITMWLWLPEQALGLEDIADMGPDITPEGLEYYRSVEEVGWSMEEFAQMFVENERACFESPAEMWP